MKRLGIIDEFASGACGIRTGLEDAYGHASVDSLGDYGDMTSHTQLSSNSINYSIF
jgi:hypothetical protein